MAYVLKSANKNELEGFDEKEAINRIKALLSQWLRMENQAVLLGSGCSLQHEGLLFWDLESQTLEFLKDKYQNPDYKDDAAFKIINNRMSQRCADNFVGTNFEEWLSYLTNAHFLLQDKNSGLKKIELEVIGEVHAKTLETLLLDIEKLIFSLCTLELPMPQMNGVTTHHAFVAKLLARDPSLGRAHIFTTNYDTLIEQALDHLNILYADGFTGKSVSRFDTSSYGLDVYYPGEVSEGRVRRYDKYLHLYKLHGSISWKIDPEIKDIISKHPNLKQARSWKTETELKGKIKKIDNAYEETNGTLGILPTANKFSQTLSTPFAHLFRSLNIELKKQQTFLLIMGYGFADEHINKIIDDAMTNPSLVLLVVSPTKSDTIYKYFQKYAQLGERAFYLYSEGGDIGEIDKSEAPATFYDFTHNLMPNIKWLDEFVKLRQHEKKIESTNSRPPKEEGIV
tara:strand:+ start:493 stop:1854 length:1362 start_codon:yes stop_codon:yes gene_type:complete